jgi:CRP-like cAMP-binding protein
MIYQADLLTALQSIPWFLDLQPKQFDRLAKISDICQLKTGQELFFEGGREDSLFIVLEGQIAVEIRIPGNSEVRVYTAEIFDIVGWSSLTPVVRQRTATARALLPSRLIEFQAEALRLLCEEDHDIGYTMMRRVSNVIASRLLVTRLALMDLMITPGHTSSRFHTTHENP